MDNDTEDKFPNRFKKGQSGNPKGRPQGSISITTALRKYLVKHPDEVKRVVKAWLASCKMGNVSALTELLNRLEGKVAEKHELETKVPITLVFQPATMIGNGQTQALPERTFIEGEAVEVTD